jgi:hypothetical protein
MVLSNQKQDILFLEKIRKMIMKRILKKLDWWFDCYIAYFSYNGNKQHRYIEYMKKKWPEKMKEYENK